MVEVLPDMQKEKLAKQKVKAYLSNDKANNVNKSKEIRYEQRLLSNRAQR